MASTYLLPSSPRRRATAVALTVVVHVLLVLLLLRLGPREYVPMDRSSALSTFTVAPEAAGERRPTPRRQQQQRPAAAPARATPPAPPPIPFKDTSGVIWLTREQYAATALKPSAPRAAAAGEADAAIPGESLAADDSSVVGTAPGGQRLYSAAWKREPTDAELRTYLPAVTAGSWGVIACRTIANFEVENCQALDESPRGSGIASGMRRAAWQFRVIPPRIGGRPQLGTWVRIRIDITARGAAVR